MEIDPRLAAQLPTTVETLQPGAPLQVITADALRVTELPAPPRRLVANLPYNVSVPVLLHLLETFPSLESALVMVQAEVGQRLAAAPGSKVYGSPSAKAAWYGRWFTQGQSTPSSSASSGASAPEPRRSVARRSRSSTRRSASAGR